MRKYLIIIIVFSITQIIFPNKSKNFLNRILKSRDTKITKNYKRLASGRRLLSDDPANYIIYEKLETYIRETDKIISNDTDMISYYKYKEAILSNIIDLFQRIRELLIMKSNSLYAEDEIEIINNEINQYYKEFKYILTSAEFNKVKVFKIIFDDEVFKNYFVQDKYYNIGNVDNLLKYFIQERSKLGAVVNVMEKRIEGESIKKENELRFQSNIDINFANEISALKKNRLIFIVNILLL